MNEGRRGKKEKKVINVIHVRIGQLLYVSVIWFKIFNLFIINWNLLVIKFYL